jgi:spore coat protein U-like protein
VYRHALLAAGATMLLVTGSARAGIDCEVSAVGINFGTYDGLLATPTDSVGRVEVTCYYSKTGGAVEASYVLRLSPGGSGSYAARSMSLGSSLLPYNLYTDASHSQVWGNGSDGSLVIRGSLKVNPGAYSTVTKVHTIYGRIPAGMDAAMGLFGDTVLVTLTY